MSKFLFAFAIIAFGFVTVQAAESSKKDSETNSKKENQKSLPKSTDHVIEPLHLNSPAHSSSENVPIADEELNDDSAPRNDNDDGDLFSPEFQKIGKMNWVQSQDQAESSNEGNTPKLATPTKLAPAEDTSPKSKSLKAEQLATESPKTPTNANKHETSAPNEA